MHAMILAAGRGERLRPLTDTTPKALIEVAGKPLVVHAIERLYAAGITDIVINLGWLGGQIRERLDDGAALGVRIVYSDEGENTLETAGGIVNALPLLGAEPFWVVNCDVLCDYPFPDLKLAPNDLAHFVLVKNPARKESGDFPLDNGRVGAENGERLTYAGIGLYRPEFFAGESAERKPLLPLMQRAAAAGRVAGEHYRGRWLDIGTPERLATARNG
ncbi:MAG: N-acetylmuramate alpha-1-phosphate uridylyltransferase MurU [Gammaproteobacteria bacterium]